PRSLLSCPLAPRALHSSPTRRSSDLGGERREQRAERVELPGSPVAALPRRFDALGRALGGPDVVQDEIVRGSPSGVREPPDVVRSEEYTSELQSRGHLVCRLLLEKKK